MKGHDLVVHLAANPEARWGLERTRLDLEQGTIVDLQRRSRPCAASGVPQLIFSSSGTVYGETEKTCAEGDLGNLPISLYGASKFAGEALISAFVECFGLTGAHLPLRQRGRPARHARRGARFPARSSSDTKTYLEVLGDGRQSKPYLHVTDCVAGMLFGLDHAPDKLNIHNLAPLDATSVARIAELCVAASPYPNAAHPLHRRRSRLAGRRAALAHGSRASSPRWDSRCGTPATRRWRARWTRWQREVFGGAGGGWPDQAVVLAGGLGTRMLPRTERMPKILLPVAGRPFAAWLLERLAAAGFAEVLLAIGHLGGEVRRAVGDGSAFGLRVRYAEDGERLLGTAGALRRALGELAPELPGHLRRLVPALRLPRAAARSPRPPGGDGDHGRVPQRRPLRPIQHRRRRRRGWSATRSARARRRPIRSSRTSTTAPPRCGAR